MTPLPDGGSVRSLVDGESVSVPLGEASIDVALPRCEVDVAEPAGGAPVDVAAAAERALDDPAGPPVSELATRGDAVAIAVTDVTRATPDDVLLAALLERLFEAGVDRSDVTVVVGLGLHRPLTDEEIEREYGEHADLVGNHDPDAAVEVGRIDPALSGSGSVATGSGSVATGSGAVATGAASEASGEEPDPGTSEDGSDTGVSDGEPGTASVAVEVHPAIADADLVCATGMVEPHQYAGFSGGAKTVAIGCGGESLIRYTHGPELLGRPGVRLGRVRDNPFRELVDRAGDVTGPEFCLNVTHGPAGVLGVRAGAPREVVRELADVAREALAVPVEGPYDAVVAGVGAPKDASLYQASRAATYVALGDRNPLCERGRIVVPARLAEGAGQGTGEQRFRDWLAGGESPTAVHDAMREGYEPGAQRAFVLARVLRQHDLYVTNLADDFAIGGDGDEASGFESPAFESPAAVAEACHVRVRPQIADAVEPGSDVLVVPEAIETLLVDPATSDPDRVGRSSDGANTNR